MLKEKEKTEIKSIEFDTVVRSFTTSAYIPISKNFAGKRVHVKVNVIEE